MNFDLLFVRVDKMEWCQSDREKKPALKKNMLLLL